MLRAPTGEQPANPAAGTPSHRRRFARRTAGRGERPAGLLRGGVWPGSPDLPFVTRANYADLLCPGVDLA
ncbi:hypothetical protein GCM10010452_51530 [Crossiella cryophila]